MPAEPPKIRFNDDCRYVDFDGATEQVPFGEWPVVEGPLFSKVMVGPRELVMPSAALEKLLAEWKAKRLPQASQ